MRRRNSAARGDRSVRVAPAHQPADSGWLEMQSICPISQARRITPRLLPANPHGSCPFSAVGGHSGTGRSVWPVPAQCAQRVLQGICPISRAGALRRARCGRICRESVPFRCFRAPSERRRSRLHGSCPIGQRRLPRHRSPKWDRYTAKRGKAVGLRSKCSRQPAIQTRRHLRFRCP
jgi:hypothetical protein